MICNRPGLMSCSPRIYNKKKKRKEKPINKGKSWPKSRLKRNRTKRKERGNHTGLGQN